MTIHEITIAISFSLGLIAGIAIMSLIQEPKE